MSFAIFATRGAGSDESDTRDCNNWPYMSPPILAASGVAYRFVEPSEEPNKGSYGPLGEWACAPRKVAGSLNEPQNEDIASAEYAMPNKDPRKQTHTGRQTGRETESKKHISTHVDASKVVLVVLLRWCRCTRRSHTTILVLSRGREVG